MPGPAATHGALQTGDGDPRASMRRTRTSRMLASCEQRRQHKKAEGNSGIVFLTNCAHIARAASRALDACAMSEQSGSAYIGG